jgi:hypothetical protein
VRSDFAKRTGIIIAAHLTVRRSAHAVARRLVVVAASMLRRAIRPANIQCRCRDESEAYKES